MAVTTIKGPKHRDVIVQLSGVETNTFALMGRVRRALLDEGYTESAAEFVKRAAVRNSAGMIALANQYVTLE